MLVKDIIENLRLEVICGNAGLSNEVNGGYTSDLLSDVMGRAKEGQVWITLQTHKNIVAVASLKDLAAVILTRGAQPDQDAIDASEKEGIPILVTSENAFEISAKLYNLMNSK